MCTVTMAFAARPII